MSDGAPTIRPAARALIIDTNERLLLFHHHDTSLREPDLWVPPSGALAIGETYGQALQRELWEEIGLSDVRLGPWVWSRRHVFRMAGNLYDARERYYLVRVESLTVQPQNLDPIEELVMVEHRWWSIPEIQSASGSEVFVPRSLGELLAPIIAGDIPQTPLEVGE